MKVSSYFLSGNVDLTTKNQYPLHTPLSAELTTHNHAGESREQDTPSTFTHTYASITLQEKQAS